MSYETDYAAWMRQVEDNIGNPPAAFAWRIRDTEARRLAALDRPTLWQHCASVPFARCLAGSFEARTDHYHEVLARLANSAPDLLAALEELVAESEPTDDPREFPRSDPNTFGQYLARAAIARAKGDTP